MSIYDKASLVLIPSGTKTSKVYSQKPVNGDGDFTFSRSTAATRVNADGNIEKETQNLLLQSNNFDTTWVKSNIDLTANQSGYDGSNDAWKLQKTSTNSYKYVAQTISVSGVQTASFYVKAGTLTQVGILVSGGDNPYVSYNLSTGTIIGQRASVIDSSITDVGSGWYRCTMTYNTPIADINIYPDWNLNNTGNLYLQDVQLEQGLVARDYIETTTAAVEGGITDNVPRLDYTDSSCPALLLEPQRTNLFTESETFDSNAWEAFGGATLTTNDAVSPEGVQNATKITAGGVYEQSIFTADTNYSFSLFVKSDTATTLTLGYADQSGPYRGGSVRYTFATGAVAVLSQSPNASVTADKEDYGNGWIRVIMNFKTNVAQNYNYQDISWGGGSGWMYGAQLESGSYATSYIPTYGSSVTRVPDRAEIENGSFFPTAYPFTLYAESPIIASGSEFLFNICNKNTTNSYAQLSIGNGVPRVLCRYSGGEVIALSPDSVSASTIKMAAVFTESSIKLFVDGELKTTETNTTPFQSGWNDSLIGQLRIAADTGNRTSNKMSLLFPTALTDQEAIDLTTI